MRPEEIIWQWFIANRSKLERAAPDEIAEHLGSVAASVEKRVGVEVSVDGDTKEVIFTAGGDANIFETVRQIVAAAPQLDGWSFRALKPPGGFDFSIRTDKADINVNELSFAPLEAEGRPWALGIRLLFEIDTDLDVASELAPLIVETGVGEEAAAKISYLQVDRQSGTSEDGLPISTLGQYIGWHFARRDDLGTR